MPGPNARYTPLAASREDEMEAAFESDDEDTTDASRPMLPQSRAAAPPGGAGSPTTPSHAHSPSTTTPGGYNFEQVYDYDWARPPPGSPPRPSATALPNDIGNTNGELPSASRVWRPSENPTFLQRTLRSLFPARYARVATTEAGSRPMGGGSGNDGVFANVTAKPTAARVERTPDGVYVMPEEAQKDTPPSYTAAQADAVPPYWETTVHAPSASVVGEMVVDGLATGTLFSFLWNMLISLSFNFVGFLLTYLLHTTHAAKYGSRAGLGITMLQYGFALRNREPGSSDDYWPGMDVPEPTPANERSLNANETLIAITQAIATPTAAAPADDTMQDGSLPYPHEWIAFFLMTIGWFLVLTSFLGYWRVKRWEYQILAANRSTAASSATSTTSTGPTVSPAEQLARDRAVRRNLEQLFGFSAATRRDSSDPVMISAARRRERERDLEAGPGAGTDDDEASLTPEERRLREDLRAAGLI